MFISLHELVLTAFIVCSQKFLRNPPTKHLTNSGALIALLFRNAKKIRKVHFLSAVKLFFTHLSINNSYITGSLFLSKKLTF